MALSATKTWRRQKSQRCLTHFGEPFYAKVVPSPTVPSCGRQPLAICSARSSELLERVT